VSYVLSRLLALLSALPQLFTAKLAGTQLLPAKSPALIRERVESPELIGNRLVQTRAADLLCSLAQCAASGDSPEAARQLRDNRLQFSRLALHCLCSALAACYSHWTVESHVFSARIVQFNEIGVGWLTRAAHVKSLASLTLRLLALMKPSRWLDCLPLSGQPLLMLALRLGLGPACHIGGDHVTWYGFVSDLLPHCAGSHLGQVVTLTTGSLCDTLSLRETPAPPDLQPMALACLHGVLDRALRARDASAHRRILQLVVSDDLNMLLTAASSAELQEDATFVDALIDLVPLKDLLNSCRTNQAALKPTVCVAKRLNAQALASHGPELQSLLRECLPGSRSEVPFLQLELFHALLLALKEADRDSRGRRDLQDLAGLLVASVATILGSTAERQSWFRASVACTEEEVALSCRAARLLEQAMFLLLDH
uniref:DUF2428 domain-containing protein n=1 Tax=Macrostomum lignano TaxID=282301 RepID=A0A1I8FGC6_9PLAT